MTALWPTLTGVALLLWILVLLDPKRAFPSSRFLAHSGGESSPGPGVVAIVPARNEVEVIPETLPSLLGQDHDPFRVVLVDDRSDDGTAECARRIAHEMGCPERLLVVEGTSPPPSWQGKVHAQEIGLAAISREVRDLPPWLLLADADIRLPPDSVRSLLAQASAGGFSLVSVMARLHAVSFWERILIPPFVFFFHLLYPFRRVSDPSSGVAAAAGGCVLLRRESLLAAGGFKGIAGEIIDDVALARAVKASGGLPWLGFDPGIVSVRSSPHLGDLWRMVSRTAFVQLRHRWDLLALTVLALLVFLVAPPFLAGGELLGDRPFSALAALGAWWIPSRLLWPYTRYHGVGGAHAFLLPAAAFFFLLMTTTSAWDYLRGRGPAWKGRRYGPSGPSGDERNERKAQ